jgi:hypothetical protein
VAVSVWHRRLAQCADNQRRFTERSAQLARLNLSLGEAPAPIPGMPLRTGAGGTTFSTYRGEPIRRTDSASTLAEIWAVDST